MVPDRALFLPFFNTFDDLGNQRMGICDPTCPVFAPGHAATGVKFDGTACLRYDDVAAFDTPTFTIGAWVDADAFVGGTIVSKPYAGETTKNDSYQLWTDTTPNIRFVTYSGSVANDTSTTPRPSPKPWQFVVASFDGTTNRIYVDGVEQFNGLGKGPVRFDSGSIRVGCDYDSGAPSSRVTGTIDDVLVYTRALSNAEVAALAAM